MKGRVGAGEFAADIESGPSGEIHVRLSSQAGRQLAEATFSPEKGNGWTVLGWWNAGEPEPVVVVPDDALPHVNPDAGLWRLHVLADNPQHAINIAAREAKATLPPPEITPQNMPDRPLAGEAIPWPRAG